MFYLKTESLYINEKIWLKHWPEFQEQNLKSRWNLIHIQDEYNLIKGYYMIHFLVSIYIDSTPYNYFITDLNEGDECIINYQR
jgi:hypothetical protein